MTKPSLTNPQKTTLRRSSRQSVGASFDQLRAHVTRGRWLGVGNRYAVNTVNRLRSDLDPPSTVNGRHLAQYIAASGPLHCADGWTYLGRAMICLARGDPGTALHLAYYAELRAAMALLATEGVGIFSKQHFVVDQGSNCVRIPKATGTHVITWLALEHWADLQRSSELLTMVITPGSVPLSDWLTQFGATITTGLVTSKTLKRWGLDLKHLSEDRDARNEASYRPDRLVLRSNVEATAASQFLRNLWGLFEPIPVSRFETLDRHLLRETLEQTYTAITGKSPTADPVDYGSRLDRMLSGLSPSGLSTSDWKQFLLRSTAPDTPLVIQQAATREKFGSPHHHMQVISRASLLLRVATGACNRLIGNASFGGLELQFWWDQIGTDLGLWDAATTPTQLIDLWADIQSALEDLQIWEDANASSTGSLANWWVQLSPSLSTLGTSERVALWGLGF
jgi:hypothetical protein